MAQPGKWEAWSKPKRVWVSWGPSMRWKSWRVGDLALVLCCLIPRARLWPLLVWHRCACRLPHPSSTALASSCLASVCLPVLLRGAVAVVAKFTVPFWMFRSLSMIWTFSSRSFTRPWSRYCMRVDGQQTTKNARLTFEEQHPIHWRTRTQQGFAPLTVYAVHASTWTRATLER